MKAIVGNNEVINSREFDYPRERVFAAWTRPEELALWWGPDGFTNTFHEFDLRPGGHWRFDMHGPDGVDYPNHIVFAEISSPERIILDHLGAPEFRVTATFEERDGRTLLTFRQSFAKTEEFEQAIKYCVEANEQVLDRLDGLLAERPSE